MGRGRSSSSRGSSSSGRGSSSWSRSSRGSSSWSRSSTSSGSRNTVVIWNSGGRHYGGGSSAPVNSLAVAIVVCVVCCIVALPLLFFGFSGFMEIGQYSTVSAKCVDNTYMGGYYYTIYEYSVDGNSYVNRSNEGWEIPEIKDEIVTIYYLKSNPNEISEESPADFGTSLFFTAGGLIFAAVGIIPLVVTIKNKKKGTVESGSDISEDNIPSSSVEEKSRCLYCGAKYSSSLDACPKCGASKF